MYKRIGCFLGILSAFGGVALCADVSSLTYQSNVGVNFTFNSALSLTLDTADIYIESLAPGTVSDSNIITVNVTTNNKLGYTLTSTVGNATYSNRNLNLSGSNNNFASVNYGANIASNANLTDNTWGYSYSVDNGTNWVAGSAGATTAGYSGLPLYTDTTNITTLRTRPGPTGVNGDDTKFKIAARASSAQAAGDYKNVINFNVVAEPEPMTLAMAYAAAGKGMFNGYYVMQDMTPQICANTEEVEANSALQVIDIRDNNIYWVTKLADGRCWMLENLALDPTQPTTAVGMNANNTNASVAAIDNLLHGGSNTTGWSGVAIINTGTNFVSNGSAEPRINNASRDTLVTSYGLAAINGQAKAGVYYNYCAASASTYCYEGNYGVDIPSTNIDAPQDICPASWRMPTGGEDSEYAEIIGAYNFVQNATDVNSVQYNLSTPLSGGYDVNSAIGQNNWGGWWSSTFSSGYSMYVLDIDPVYVDELMDYNRRDGATMRCIADQ